MILRSLEDRDAEKMIEWMHDEDTVINLHAPFMEMTVEDCIEFIKASRKEEEKNIHKAIALENGEYVGTVSLKNIVENTAEFAIVVSPSVMGTGIASEAMNDMLSFAFLELQLQKVYWCVDPNNKRALRFYQKKGYKKINSTKFILPTNNYTDEEIEKYIWFLEENKDNG